MPELGGMDTRSTPHRSPASTSTVAAGRAIRRGVILFLIAGCTTWAVSTDAQTAPDRRSRRGIARANAVCGGDTLDGVCSDSCSGRPWETNYDADCFSCDQFVSPEPKRACRTPGEPCEIHEGISRLGEMVESGAYDDSLMRGVVLAYWDEAAWDLSTHWGASSLDGYVVYAVVRSALEYESEVAQRPTTMMALECALRDHADRGLPTMKNNGERWFHGAPTDWNSWSEDYMGFALGYAAADAWFSSPAAEGDYYDQYYDRVEQAAAMAFSIGDGTLHTLVREVDPDPAAGTSGPSVMMRNHDEYSPVYAMAILKHVADVNNVYRAAALPPRFTCSNKPSTFDALFRWVAGKIEPNPLGAGYVFRSDGCQRQDGELSYCDDRPGDPSGSAGSRREPGHYPLADYLPDLCVAEDLEYFSASCEWVGPAGIEQTSHNYVFNCVFTGEIE